MQNACISIYVQSTAVSKLVVSSFIATHACLVLNYCKASPVAPVTYQMVSKHIRKDRIAVRSSELAFTQMPL